MIQVLSANHFFSDLLAIYIAIDLPFVFLAVAV